jgi:F-type H+-transporting ATPase subunit beta
LKVGKVLRVIGPVVDVEFFAEELPALYNAIRIDRLDGTKLIVEVSQYLGENVVRCVAMSTTDGLVRGMDAVDTGESITMPVGRETLGRVFNLLGETIDKLGDCSKNDIPSTVPAPLKNRFFESDLKQGSRSLTSLNPTRKAERSASSVVQAWERPF